MIKKQESQMNSKNYLLGGNKRKQFILNYILRSYQDYIQSMLNKKCKTDTSICFSYFYYLAEIQNSKQLCFTEIIKLGKYLELSIREKGILKQILQQVKIHFDENSITQSRLIEQNSIQKNGFNQIKNKQDNLNQNSVDLVDLFIGITFDEQFNQLEKDHFKLLEKKQDLIQILSHDHIDIINFKQKASEFKILRDKYLFQLKKLSNINGNNIKIQYLQECYINYFSFGETKKFLFNKRKADLDQNINGDSQYLSNQNIQNKEQIKDNQIFSNKSLIKNQKVKIDPGVFDKHNCVVFISLIDKPGTIKRAQNRFENIFGYKISETIGQNISMIMPKTIGKYHSSILIDYLNNPFPDQNYMGEDEQDIQSNNQGQDKIIQFNQKSLLIGKDINGWAVPLRINIKTDVIGLDDCGFTGYMKTLQDEFTYIQTNCKYFKVEIISQRIYERVFESYMSKNDIQNVYLNRIVPLVHYLEKKWIKNTQKNNEINQYDHTENDFLSTIAFLPKIDATKVKQKQFSFFHKLDYDNLQFEIKKLNLENYDIYQIKLKLYLHRNLYFKYNIIQIASMKKLIHPLEMKENIINFSNQAKLFLQVKYEVNKDLQYLDQFIELLNFDTKSQGNNSFSDCNRFEDNSNQQNNMNKESVYIQTVKSDSFSQSERQLNSVKQSNYGGVSQRSINNPIIGINAEESQQERNRDSFNQGQTKRNEKDQEVEQSENNLLSSYVQRVDQNSNQNMLSSDPKQQIFGQSNILTNRSNNGLDLSILKLNDQGGQQTPEKTLINHSISQQSFNQNFDNSFQDVNKGKVDNRQFKNIEEYIESTERSAKQSVFKQNSQRTPSLLQKGLNQTQYSRNLTTQNSLFSKNMEMTQFYNSQRTIHAQKKDFHKLFSRGKTEVMHEIENFNEFGFASVTNHEWKQAKNVFDNDQHSKSNTNTQDQFQKIQIEKDDKKHAFKASSSVKSTTIYNHNFKKLMRKKIVSKQKNFLLKAIYIFGYISFLCISIITIQQYFNIKNQLQISNKTFQYVPWPLSFRCNYSLSSIHVMMLQMIQRKIFDNLNQANNYSDQIESRLMLAYNNLRNLFIDYVKSDFDEVSFFKEISQEPTAMIYTKDLATQTGNILSSQEKYKVKVNMTIAYFIQVSTGTIFRYATQRQNNLMEQIVRIDNFPGLNANVTLIDTRIYDESIKLLDYIQVSTLQLLLIVTIVSFLLITMISPLYYYVQKTNEHILRLFSTMRQEQLDCIFQPVYLELVLANKQYNSNIIPIICSKKRKNISTTSSLPKFNIPYIIVSIITFAVLIIQPIANFIMIVNFQQQEIDNLNLLRTLYSMRAQLISNISQNYNYMVYKMDPTYKLYNPKYYETRIPQLITTNTASLQQMYDALSELNQKTKFQQEEYDKFFNEVFYGNICSALSSNSLYVTSDNNVNYDECMVLSQGTLQKGFVITIKKMFGIFSDLNQYYQIKDLKLLQQSLIKWEHIINIKEFNESFEVLSKSMDSIKDFMLKMVDDHVKYNLFVQTILLIFQFVTLVIVFYFGWIQFYEQVQKDMYTVKSLLSILPIETVLDNPYIISFLNK